MYNLCLLFHFGRPLLPELSYTHKNAHEDTIFFALFTIFLRYYFKFEVFFIIFP